MIRLKHFVLAGTTAAALLLTPALHAAQVAGVTIADTATVAGQPLVLNGAGLRSKVFIKVYVIGLYLPRKESTAAGALAQPGAKRVQLVMMRDVSGEDLADSLVKSLNANASAAEQAQLQARVDTLKANMRALGEARKGSQIQLDFQPATGTRVTMDGKQVGQDLPGEDFFRALMRIWLGDSPAQDSVKNALLGKAE